MLHLVIFSLVLLFASCHPIKQSQSLIPSGHHNKTFDKKGTIRIAGPWHSDSALDRNIDIGEDSYVKKIISSNEGINLNKDIAEAGEMFEVNGIDDFYDKNALITYEINGHEIPVHMRPHLTPQSKSLFPEYAKDSPLEMGGVTRNGKGSPHRHANKINGFRLPPGLTLNDLPEYKMARYTGKSQDEPENAWKSFQGLEKEKEIRKLKPYAQQNRLLASLLRKQLPLVSKFTHHRHAHHPSNDGINSDEENLIESLKHKVPRYKLQNNGENILQDFMQKSPHYEKTRKHHRVEQPVFDTKGSQLQPEYSESAPQAGPRKTTALFENLSTLHDKLQRDKEINEADLRVHSMDDQTTPKKQKAKTRILSLLGELTDKLKGMESIVSAHREKKVETFLENREREEESIRKPDMDGDSETYGNFVKPHGEPVNNIVDIGHQFHDGVAQLHQKIDDEMVDEEKAGHRGDVDETEANVMLSKSFAKIDDVENGGSRHSIESSKKGSDEIFKHFTNDNKPIIMDTKEIDYKPPGDAEDEGEKSSVSEEGDDEEEGKEEKSKKRKYENFKGKVGENYDDDSDELENRKHSSDVADEPLSRYHHKNQQRYESESKDDVDDDEKNMNQKLSRRHRHHRHHKDEGNDDVVYDGSEGEKHHRHHKDHFVDEDSDDKEEGEHSSIVSKHHNKEEEDTEALDEKESSKMTDVEESLGEADEKNTIARRRSFKPKLKATVPAPSLDSDVQYPDYNEVKDAAIFETNLLRKKFHAPAVHWSDKLSDRAQKAAETLSAVTDLNEKTLSRYRQPGENVAVINIESPNVGKDAPDLWARGSQYFDFRSPQLTNKNADFAQMVWKADNEFGLGVAKSKLGNQWIVTSAFDAPAIDSYKDLRSNVESDIPISDPYSDITG